MALIWIVLSCECGAAAETLTGTKRYSILRASATIFACFVFLGIVALSVARTSLVCQPRLASTRLSAQRAVRAGGALTIAGIGS